MKDATRGASLPQTLSRDFLAQICCPQTRVPLRVLEGRALRILESAALRDASGRLCSEWEGVLALADGTAIFPVRAGIPVLLVEERVPVPEPLVSQLRDVF